MCCADERCDSAPVIKASQEKEDARLTELIMKDPVADLSLKRQPREYYKCHLHMILWGEKQKTTQYMARKVSE